VEQVFRRCPTFRIGGKVMDGQTHTIDHIVQEFTIKIRSLEGVSQSVLKRKIEEKYEVVEIKLQRNYYCSVPSPVKDFIDESY
jgi:hypothetical protein